MITYAAPCFELLRGAAPAAAPRGLASLSGSLLAQQAAEQQQAQAQGRRLFSQLPPLFELARAAAGPTVETGLRVVRVAGDGRCMFRALAQGLARNQGRFLGGGAEEQEADQLRLAVAEALCRTAARRNEFAQAVYAVEAEDKMQNYCRRIMAPTFWGGEPELLVLSQMLRVPILVYIPAREAGSRGGGSGYVPIQTYGEQFLHGSGKKKKAGGGGGGKPAGKKKRRVVRLLYSGSNHYDLLLNVYAIKAQRGGLQERLLSTAATPALASTVRPPLRLNWEEGQRAMQARRQQLLAAAAEKRVQIMFQPTAAELEEQAEPAAAAAAALDDAAAAAAAAAAARPGGSGPPLLLDAPPEVRAAAERRRRELLATAAANSYGEALLPGAYPPPSPAPPPPEPATTVRFFVRLPGATPENFDQNSYLELVGGEVRGASAPTALASVDSLVARVDGAGRDQLVVLTAAFFPSGWSAYATAFYQRLRASAAWLQAEYGQGASVYNVAIQQQQLRFSERLQTCTQPTAPLVPRKPTQPPPNPPAETSIYLYAWSGVENPGPKCRDVVVTLDATPESATFGSILSVSPIPNWGTEPHHVGLVANGSVLAVGGIQAYLRGAPDINLFNVTSPARPRWLTAVDPPLSAVTDSFSGQADGGFWVSQMGDKNGGTPGRMARIGPGPAWEVVGEYPQAPPPGFNPHGFAIWNNKLVTAAPQDSAGFMTVQFVGSSGVAVSGNGKGILYGLNVSAPNPGATAKEIYLPKGTYPHAVTSARNGTLLAVSTYYIDHHYNGKSIGTIHNEGSREVFFFDVLDGGNRIEFSQRRPVVDFKHEVGAFLGTRKCGAYRPHGMAFKTVTPAAPRP
ncbi:OTU domain-containing protein [Micractinium conductrix]|uniref:Ubiquitin thioesterase OTU n=1 Tax=Micractinium conductrix TaxID=554055 RepID=A0A2P6V6R4_9CHLO|nr:OTU domain-containing protein [Micractinium conductrix]|eukprot:PSC69777.1 OTU domain-containing protein [Micractinium conductrix]